MFIFFLVFAAPFFGLLGLVSRILTVERELNGHWSIDGLLEITCGPGYHVVNTEVA